MFRTMLCALIGLGLAAGAATTAQAQWRPGEMPLGYDYRYQRYGRDYRLPDPRTPYRYDQRMDDRYYGRQGSYYRGPLDRGRNEGYGYQHGPYRHAEAPLRIVRLLPDVAGPDDGREIVTIYNGSRTPIDLRGWWLQDRHANRFPLRGVIQPGETVDIRTDGSMPLNNGGDTVMIVDPRGGVVHSVTYYGDQVQVNRPIDF